MKTFSFALSFFLFISPAVWAGNHFTQEQNQAVAIAQQFGLPMSRLDLQVDGIERSILILGETHVKPAETAAQELNLISAFDFRLIEGYGGSGKEKTWKEKALLQFIGFIYPIMRRFQKQGQPSSLGKTYESGFYRHVNGWLYYNRCYVGHTTENGFFTHTANNEIILNGMKESGRLLYRKRLLRVGRNSTEVRRLTGADHLINNNSGKSCSVELAVPEFKNIATFAIEVGDLAKWDRANICGDLVCLYSRNGKPSTRELRMAENIVLTLKAFPEQQTALVLVGAGHIAGLNFLLSSWSEKQGYYSRP